MPKKTITTLLELVGLALIVVGIWLIAPPVAFIAGGGGLIGISFLIMNPGSRR